MYCDRQSNNKEDKFTKCTGSNASSGSSLSSSNSWCSPTGTGTSPMAGCTVTHNNIISSNNSVLSILSTSISVISIIILSSISIVSLNSISASISIISIIYHGTRDMFHLSSRRQLASHTRGTSHATILCMFSR